MTQPQQDMSDYMRDTIRADVEFEVTTYAGNLAVLGIDWSGFAQAVGAFAEAEIARRMPE